MLAKISQKAFHKGDIIVYLIILILVSALFFWSFYLKTDGEGFTISLKGETIMTGDFDEGSYVILKGDNVEVLSGTQFKIYSGEDYNILSVDWTNRDVTVTDTNCGTTKECTYMHLKNGDIICVPHSLIVRYTGKIPDPVVG